MTPDNKGSDLSSISMSPQGTGGGSKESSQKFIYLHGALKI